MCDVGVIEDFGTMAINPIYRMVADLKSEGF